MTSIIHLTREVEKVNQEHEKAKILLNKRYNLISRIKTKQSANGDVATMESLNVELTNAVAVKGDAKDAKKVAKKAMDDAKRRLAIWKELHPDESHRIEVAAWNLELSKYQAEQKKKQTKKKTASKVRTKRKHGALKARIAASAEPDLVSSSSMVLNRQIDNDPKRMKTPEMVDHNLRAPVFQTLTTNHTQKHTKFNPNTHERVVRTVENYNSISGASAITSEEKSDVDKYEAIQRVDIATIRTLSQSMRNRFESVNQRNGFLAKGEDWVDDSTTLLSGPVFSDGKDVFTTSDPNKVHCFCSKLSITNYVF
jgi:hypothetical protein